MDGFEQTDNIIVIGATNHPDALILQPFVQEDLIKKYISHFLMSKEEKKYLGFASIKFLMISVKQK
jgi:SpoVK/Ycf46/Vps4 family AAA+-type ATPase